MNKKIMYTFIPAIAAIGALVGFKSSVNETIINNNVINSSITNKTKNNNSLSNNKYKNSNETLIDQDYIDQDNNNLVLSSGVYYLTGNIDLSSTSSKTNHGFILKENADVTFYLDTHFIKGCDGESVANANIFSIDSGCTLNLYDFTEAPEPLPRYYFTEHDKDNPEKNYWEPSTGNVPTNFYVDGGCLYCNNCVAVATKGTLNMGKISIVGNSIDNSTTQNYGTPNTIISTPSSSTEASINIEKGSVVGCNAENIIYGGTGSTITVSGGEIKKSYAKESIIYNSSKTEMTGGKINNCYTGDGNKTNAILLNKNSSEAMIAGTAEITDNITLLNNDISMSRYTVGSVVTYDKSTTIKLGGTAKVIRNRTSTDLDSEHTYAKKIETTELANISIHYATPLGTNNPVITPITSDDHPHVLKKGARFGVRTLNEGGQPSVGYEFSKETSDTSYKQFFFSDDSKMIVGEVQSPALHHLKLNSVNSIDINGQIKKKSETPSKKPTIDNAILLKGKLDKSIEVVIRDKEDLGEIKETVEDNIKKELTSESHLISQFDISLEQDGVEIENIDGNKYGVTLKLPNNYAGLKKQKVIYIKDDGSIETKDTTVKGNKCYFETDHFSTWGFAAEGKLGAGLSGGAIAGIVLGTAVGGGGIYFGVFIIFLKKKLRFFVNGYKIYEERLKRNEDIDFTNNYVAGKQWYSDKECTKPFTKTKMGLLNKSVYTKSDDTYGGNKYNTTQVNSICKLITSLKNKMKSFFKKKDKAAPEEQNNVASEEEHNNDVVPEEHDNTVIEDNNDNNEIR